MGSLNKKLRRKKYNKAKKQIIRSFHKLTPDERKEKLNGVKQLLDYIDDRVNGGEQKAAIRRKPPVTPGSVIDDIDSMLKEVEADEENRKVDTD